MDERLREYGLHIEHSELEDGEPIDFEIRDNHDELYATVWGSEPWNDVQIDCNHDIVEYEDEETVGECVLCGNVCNWHYERDDDGNEVKVPHDWSNYKSIHGIIGEYLNELRERW